MREIARLDAPILEARDAIDVVNTDVLLTSEVLLEEKRILAISNPNPENLGGIQASYLSLPSRIISRL